VAKGTSTKVRFEEPVGNDQETKNAPKGSEKRALEVTTISDFDATDSALENHQEEKRHQTFATFDTNKYLHQMEMASNC